MHTRVQQTGTVQRPSGRRSVAEVLADLLGNVHDILRSELRLRHAQAREELRAFRPAGTALALGALCGLLSAFFLLVAIVAALSFVISLWIAALLVSIIMAMVCAALLRSGANLMRNRREKVAGALEDRTPWTGPPIA